MIDGLNKYLHGTVWVWPTPNDKNNIRLALVISDSRANMHSSTVNCVAVESGKKNEYINVPLNMEKEYQIRCDQIHTVPKEDLTEYAGALSPDILAAVKAKIRVHFNMDEDTRADLRKAVAGITETLTKIVEEGDKGAQGAWTATAATSTVADTAEQAYEAPAALKQDNSPQDNDSASDVDNKPEQLPEPEPEPVQVPEKTSESFSEPPKSSDNKGRKKSNKKSDEKATPISGKTGKPVRTMRKYTEEDKQFLVDPNNTTDDIMKRFDFDDKKQVHGARTYARKTLSLQGDKD